MMDIIAAVSMLFAALFLFLWLRTNASLAEARDQLADFPVRGKGGRWVKREPGEAL